MNSEPPETQQWLNRLQQGETSALVDLFEFYRPRLRDMICLRIGRQLAARFDPSDVLQEAYVDACRRLSSYVRDPRVSAYIWFFLSIAHPTLTVSDGVDSHTASTTAAITTPPAGNANNMYVWDIAFESRTRGSNRDLRVLVTIRRDSDADGIAEVSDVLVSEASVSVVITGPKGATFSGTTSSTGVFISGWLTNVTPGLYTADVTSVTQSGRTWNQTVHVESIEQFSHSTAAINGRFVVSSAPSNSRFKDDDEDSTVPLLSAMSS